MNSEFDRQNNRSRELAHNSRLATTAVFQSLLVAATSILGILVALHSTHGASLYIRWVFALALGLLLLGILFAGVVLHSVASYAWRAYREHWEWYTKIAQGKPVKNPLHIPEYKYPHYFEAATYIALIGALILLTTYAVLSSLIGV